MLAQRRVCWTHSSSRSSCCRAGSRSATRQTVSTWRPPCFLAPPTWRVMYASLNEPVGLFLLASLCLCIYIVMQNVCVGGRVPGDVTLMPK